MKFTLLAMFTVLCTTATAADRLTINVVPRVLQANGYLRLTCRVPRRPENRLLRYGVINYLESERDLDGEDSKVTWEVPFEHVPCGSTEAYCIVGRSDGTAERATMKFVMTGCDELGHDDLQ